MKIIDHAGNDITDQVRVELDQPAPPPAAAPASAPAASPRDALQGPARAIAEGVKALEAGAQVPTLDMSEAELRSRLVAAELAVAQLKTRLDTLELRIFGSSRG
jgi:hypothetical protein